jgi:hypothetical protein
MADSGGLHPYCPLKTAQALSRAETRSHIAMRSLWEVGFTLTVR